MAFRYRVGQVGGPPAVAPGVAAVDGPGTGAEELDDEGEDEQPATRAAKETTAIAANPLSVLPRSILCRNVISATPPCGPSYTTLVYNRYIQPLMTPSERLWLASNRVIMSAYRRG